MGVLLKLTEEYFDEDKVRMEDRFISNINEMKLVDIDENIDVYFADIDLVVNDKDSFTYYEMLDFYDKILKRGWDLPHCDKIDKYFYKETFPHKAKDYIQSDWRQNVGGVILNTKTGVRLRFDSNRDYSEDYWCAPHPNDSEKFANSGGFEVTFPKYYGVVTKYNNFPKTDKCKIRLVKYKK